MRFFFWSVEIRGLRLCSVCLVQVRSVDLFAGPAAFGIELLVVVSWMDVWLLTAVNTLSLRMLCLVV